MNLRTTITWLFIHRSRSIDVVSVVLLTTATLFAQEQSKGSGSPGPTHGRPGSSPRRTAPSGPGSLFAESVNALT